MNFKQIIKECDLEDKYDSLQYKLSKRIIQEKIKHRKTQQEMAALMELDIGKYLKMESTSLDFSAEEYEEAFKKFKKNLAT